MLPMNPYASHLGDRNPKDVLPATAGELERLLGALGPERSSRPPAPGKWSAREIVCHLADCEVCFAFRLRQTLAEDHHVIQPFDQERWARQYAAYCAADALAVFRSLRHWNLALIAASGPEARTKRVTHPERGSMTFQTIVETMAGHDLNHLKQIEAIRARSASA